MSEYDRIEDRQLSNGRTARIYVSTSRYGTKDLKRYTHYDCERRFKSAVEAVMRWGYRTLKTRTSWGDDADMNAYELREIRWRLSELQEWIASMEAQLDQIEGVDRLAERIQLLRNVAGRTPEESAIYLAKAEQLEKGDQ